MRVRFSRERVGARRGEGAAEEMEVGREAGGLEDVEAGLETVEAGLEVGAVVGGIVVIFVDVGARISVIKEE